MFRLAIVTVLIAGCAAPETGAGAGAGTGTAAGTETGTAAGTGAGTETGAAAETGTAAEVGAGTARPETVAPKPPPPRRAPRAIAIDRVETSRVQVSRAEDGTGRQVAPRAGGAVAIDLHIDKLPARALDPVLEINGARFRRYQVLPGGTLRFVVASAALAEAGEVVLRWGREVTAVADRLKVAP